MDSTALRKVKKILKKRLRRQLHHQRARHTARRLAIDRNEGKGTYTSEKSNEQPLAASSGERCVASSSQFLEVWPELAPLPLGSMRVGVNFHSKFQFCSPFGSQAERDCSGDRLVYSLQSPNKVQPVANENIACALKSFR